MEPLPQLLARGPWSPEAVEAVWHHEHFEPDSDTTQAADDAIQALRDLSLIHI